MCRACCVRCASSVCASCVFRALLCVLSKVFVCVLCVRRMRGACVETVGCAYAFGLCMWVVRIACVVRVMSIDVRRVLRVCVCFVCLVRVLVCARGVRRL